MKKVLGNTRQTPQAPDRVLKSDATDAVIGACVEVEAATLMGGGREAIILHNGERYKLRITSQQKLILTK